MSQPAKQARLAVDIGGTFTDVVLENGAGRYIAKVLTTQAAPEQGVEEGIRAVLDQAGMPAAAVGLFVHGTTLATNAIIERKGAKVALITTEGFRDTLVIADEGRYDQYDIALEKTKPLVPRELRFGVIERIDVAGAVRRPLDEDAVASLAPRLRDLKVESVAIGFLHAYANPSHERRAAEILEAALPGTTFTLSSEVCPELREYERFSTAVANAFVQPRMARYLLRLEETLTALGFDCPFYLMTSGGGLTTIETAVRFPIRLVESGPAGGAILASCIAEECGLDKVLSFDMGGTTAKICLIEGGRPETARTFEIDRAARFLKGSGLPIRIPVIEMVEIGAGGGSIARVDDLKRITVGPDSAGAEPGPACYDKGGEAATVTDADLVLGRVDGANFAGGQIALSPARAKSAIDASVGAALDLATPLAAYGIVEIVEETMANAARVHAIERGKTVDDFTLVAFGGAAPLHVVRLAEKLGIRRIVVPADAGVGSAIGFLRAPVAYEVVRSRYVRLAGFDWTAVNETLAGMREEALAIVAPGASGAPLTETRLAYMRYVGQGHEIAVDLPVRPLAAGDAATIGAAFEEAYVAQYARAIPGADVEILSFAVTLSTTREPAPPAPPVPTKKVASKSGERPIFDAEDESETVVPAFWRPALGPGETIAGPALIAENQTGTFIGAGFEAWLDVNGHIVIERREQTRQGERSR